MFQFLGSFHQRWMTFLQNAGLSLEIWIKGYLHFPRAYRSLSRPPSHSESQGIRHAPCLLSFKLHFKYQVSSIITPEYSIAVLKRMVRYIL